MYNCGDWELPGPQIRIQKGLRMEGCYASNYSFRYFGTTELSEPLSSTSSNQVHIRGHNLGQRFG
jgi:hypothetical protein